MRGNATNTSAPFVIFSTFEKDKCPGLNEENAIHIAEILEEDGVPFKRVALRVKGENTTEPCFIVDAADILTAKACAKTHGHECVIEVDAFRVGVERCTELAGRGNGVILGTLESALLHTLQPGDIYLSDPSGVNYIWR